MKKEIFITGGIGNQMFQYALFLALKSKGISVSMNASLYHFNRMHNGYMLGKAFDINCADEQESSKFRILWTRVVRQNRIPFVLFNEDDKHFCSEVFSTAKPYINGCWINQQYFADVENKLREVFSFKNIDSKNLSIAAEMQLCESVSLHIRRGDYLNNPMYNVCDTDYYKKAIEYIKEQHPNSFFYVFSDDPLWCNKFMTDMGVEFKVVDNNQGEHSYKDMYLMTRCRHNIIANSTFSWWGAWLGNPHNRIVVCPSSWINGRDYNPCLREWYHIK